MEVIALTDEGGLIRATRNEIKEIIHATTGTKPKEIVIGQKIPAIDYAATIEQIKALSNQYEYEKLLEFTDLFYTSVMGLKMAVANAATIEL